MNINEKVLTLEEELKKLRHKMDTHATEQMEIMATNAAVDRRLHTALESHKVHIEGLGRTIQTLHETQQHLVKMVGELTTLSRTDTKTVSDLATSMTTAIQVIYDDIAELKARTHKSIEEKW